MSYWGWKPYIPVATRRAEAQKAIQKAIKAGQDITPVALSSRTIASTFWGKAWCDNLKAYSDIANRLPRGSSYVRNGFVIDLKIQPGKVKAQVLGSKMYRIEIDITPLPAKRWKQLVGDCAGSIDTLVELLQGKFSQAVMARICDAHTGLFPSSKEIKLACSCPDWAAMCKHVAAVLYGIGARLDEQPELLFVLRKVDPNDLLAVEANALSGKGGKLQQGKALDDTALADVFGIEIVGMENAVQSAPPPRRKTKPIRAKRASAKSGSRERPVRTRSSTRKTSPKESTTQKKQAKNRSSTRDSAAGLTASRPQRRRGRSAKEQQD
jgi:uncharacterized Zn finger protein